MTLQSSDLRLTIACEADHWTIYVAGCLDLARRADIVNVAEVLADRRVSHVTIDLGRVTFIDTAGYESISRAAALIESGGGGVKVVNLSPATVRLTRALDLAG
jgi:anti-anti-sigma factor